MHIGLAEFQGENYFVLSDAHSKWPEAFRIRTTLAEKTINLLRQLFASYGLPEEVSVTTFRSSLLTSWA